MNRHGDNLAQEPPGAGHLVAGGGWRSVKILLVAVLVVLVDVIVWQVLSYEHTRIGFALLGAKAKSAVPALIEITDRNISLESRSHAVLSLGSIRPAAREAVPALLRWGTNANRFEGPDH
jgi:hypothetical protein